MIVVIRSSILRTVTLVYIVVSENCISLELLS